MKRKAAKAERQHLARIARMGCIVCELMGFYGTPAHAHHVRVDVGWGRDGHFNTIPLCPPHHTGKEGVHSMGREQFKARYGYSEVELLEIVRRRIS